MCSLKGCWISHMNTYLEIISTKENISTRLNHTNKKNRINIDISNIVVASVSTAHQLSVIRIWFCFYVEILSQQVCENVATTLPRLWSPQMERILM